MRRWEQSQEGLGQAVLIAGEASIGKSALVEVLRAQVAAAGMPRIAFRCSPYHQNSVFYPVSSTSIACSSSSATRSRRRSSPSWNGCSSPSVSP